MPRHNRFRLENGAHTHGLSALTLSRLNRHADISRAAGVYSACERMEWQSLKGWLLALVFFLGLVALCQNANSGCFTP